MSKIIVIGAGIGGIPMAFELRDLVGRSCEITVVSESDWFHFVPSNPWVAVKWRTPEDIKVYLPDVFKKLGIGFTSLGAKRVDPATKSVELNDGSSLSYDYLVIATGPRLAFDEVEGLGPEANSKSICHVDHAAKLAARLSGDSTVACSLAFDWACSLAAATYFNPVQKP